jgi:hypothetical protein
MSGPVTRAVPLVLLVVGALNLAACASSAKSTATRDAMAKASNCPADQVKVEELDGSTYRASGCGKTETYICRTPGATVVSCLPESPAQPAAEPPR